MDVIVWAVKQNCLKINTDVHINVFTVIGKIKKKVGNCETSSQS